MTRRAILSAIGIAKLCHTETVYPQVRYLPKGYRLLALLSDHNGGFSGGKDELAFFYTHPVHAAQGFNQALMVFMAPNPQAPFFSTDDKKPEAIQLAHSSGQIIQASYWDGWWQFDASGKGEKRWEGHALRWDTNHAHCITYQLSKLTIGVRGFRKAGVDFAELKKVAAAIS